MENLRWILLLAGIAIVLVVYLVSYFQGRRKQPARRSSTRTPPVINKEGHDAGETDYTSDMNEELEQLGQIISADTPAVEEVVIEMPAEKHESVAAAVQDKVFTLFVEAPRGVPFRGPVLLGALAAAKLEFGDMQIFHRIEMVNGQEKILFSVANIREPGIFDLSEMENFTSEGVVLFMQVPGSVDAVRAFDAMVESARILADNLSSRICDATHSLITNQTISHMREEVISCQLQQRVANAAS
jgi:cell division protein ZipA